MECYVKPYNSSFLKVSFSDNDTAKRFKESVSEVMQGFQIVKRNPKFYYKYKEWDGKISYYNLNNRLMNIGLLTPLQEFCINNGVNIISEIYNDTKKYTDKYIENLDIHKYDNSNNVYEKIIPDVNQRKCFITALEKKNVRLQLATSGGKSLFSYCLIHYLKNIVQGKIVVVVPRQDLANQLKNEYDCYSKFDNNFNIDDISVIHSKSKDDINNKIIFITFQTLTKQDDSYFNDIEVLIIDEAHKSSNKSLRSIIEKSCNTQYKIGMSGTFTQGDALNSSDLCLQALLGDVVEVASQRDLIKMNRASDFEGRAYLLKHTSYDSDLIKDLSKQKNKAYKVEYDTLKKIRDNDIKMLVDEARQIRIGNKQGNLKYLERRIELLNNTHIKTVDNKKWGFLDEVDFLTSCDARNKFIVNTVLNNTKGNSLIVFSRIAKHGDILNEVVLSEVKKRNLDVEVFYIHGKSTLRPDEAKSLIEGSTKRCIILANIAMVKEGWSVNNLHFCYLATTIKEPKALIQLAGRLLRKDGTDKKTALYMMLDYFGDKYGETFSVKHGISNVKTLTLEKHLVKQKEVDLNEYFSVK